MTHTLSFTQTIAVPPQIVYKALTNKVLLRQWLCDNAAIEGSGNFLFNWNDGRAVMGEYTTMDKERVALTWQAKGSGGVSNVAFALTPSEGGTRVDGAHTDIAADDLDALKLLWEDAAERLKIALETGEDTRVTRRPMLGIFPSELDAAKAARLGIPTERGVYIDNVIEGKSAQAAGIATGDVIVSIDGKPVWNFPTLTSALRRHLAGNTVTVEFYRGVDKQTVFVPLSGRDPIEKPTTPAALVEALNALIAEIDAELDAIILDIPEDGMEHTSADGEWSANETLAHLIFTERWLQIYLWSAVSGDDSLEWIDNNVTQRAGIMTAYTTGAELVALFKRGEAETVAAAAAIPAAFVAERPAFARVAETLTTMHEHTREHFAQMRAAIKNWTDTAVVAG